MNFLNKIRQKIERNREIRKTIDELQACTDRELADIGVHRCEIGRIAREYHTDNGRKRYDSNQKLAGWV